MLSKDGIFQVIKTFKTSIYRDDESVSQFLKKYYEKYIESLELLEKSPENHFIDAEVYNVLNDNIGIIKTLCDDITNVLDFYDKGFMEEAYNNFYILMEKISGYIVGHPLNKYWVKDKFYRIRITDRESEFQRKDLFHISFNERENIKAYRYSIAGYPCLYLATSLELCWFECGMPKKFYLSEYRLLPKVLYLIDFSIQPIEFISMIKRCYLSSTDRSDINRLIINYLFSYPLRIACSIEVKNKNALFIEEYILPQLLLLWIRKNRDYAGIYYNTASSIKAAHNYISNNIVLPAKNINQDGYCTNLADLFKISKPIYCDLSRIFKQYESSIEKVIKFTDNLEYQYHNNYPFYPYREILSLCKSFIRIYECIVYENYSDPEVLHSNMDTISLFAYFLKDNTDKVIERSIEEAKSMVYGISEDEIKQQIYKVIEDFKIEVMSVIVDFWNYESIIYIKTNISEDSFDYLYSN